MYRIGHVSHNIGKSGNSDIHPLCNESLLKLAICAEKSPEIK